MSPQWTDPAWRTEHLAWAGDTLGELGRRVDGEVEQRVAPWSTVFRIPTDGGPAWSKANGPGAAHEGPLLGILRGLGEHVALLPMAFDVRRAWLLLDDGGPTLRSRPAPDGRNGDTDLAAWTRILPAYAALQRRSEGHVEAMLAVGVPDARPTTAPATLARLLADDGAWSRVAAGDRGAADAARARLRALAPRVAELAAELAASPIPASVDHGDLHGNNIVFGADGGPRVFDWGDAVVAHPFATLTGTLGSIGHRAGLDAYGPELDGVREAYLTAWTDLAPLSTLDRLATLAMDLGHIAKAAAWERAVAGLAPAEMGGHHGATAAWLVALAQRLETRDST